MSNNDHSYVMSPETAEVVRGLLNVCGNADEILPTQRVNRSNWTQRRKSTRLF